MKRNSGQSASKKEQEDLNLLDRKILCLDNNTDEICRLSPNMKKFSTCDGICKAKANVKSVELDANTTNIKIESISLKEKIKQMELMHANEVELAQEVIEKLKEELERLKQVENENVDLKIEMAELKAKHSNEMKAVKGRMDDELKPFNDQVSVIPAKVCGKQRNCANCGKPSRLCTTFSHCNSYCKRMHL